MPVRNCRLILLPVGRVEWLAQVDRFYKQLHLRDYIFLPVEYLHCFCIAGEAGVEEPVAGIITVAKSLTPNVVSLKLALVTELISSNSLDLPLYFQTPVIT